jgi:hypothetical protein
VATRGEVEMKDIKKMPEKGRLILEVATTG